jgi:hypothetical protein
MRSAAFIKSRAHRPTKEAPCDAMPPRSFRHVSAFKPNSLARCFASSFFPTSSFCWLSNSFLRSSRVLAGFSLSAFPVLRENRSSASFHSSGSDCSAMLAEGEAGNQSYNRRKLSTAASHAEVVALGFDSSKAPEKSIYRSSERLSLRVGKQWGNSGDNPCY